MKLHLKIIENCTEGKFFDSNEEVFALAKRSQGRGGCMSQK